MEKKWVGVLAALLFIGGLGVLFYPAASNWLAVRSQDTTIRFYEQAVEGLSEEELEALRAEASDYNGHLPSWALADPFFVDATTEEYYRILNVDGMMGSLEIPAVGVSLPIYHGTGDEVIRKGAGHLYGSALPVGGAGTHAVLTSHSGLSSAKLFTDLEKLRLEDRFQLTVLGETLHYQVDQILVVEPNVVDALYPVEGEDYVTLITCTPYAINSHRLLVRGTRVAGPGTAAGGMPVLPAQGNSGTAFTWLPLACVAVTGAMVGLRGRRRGVAVAPRRAVDGRSRV